MSGDRTQSINSGEVGSALSHLLEREGVVCPGDAYTAKVTACGLGGSWYVITAEPGMDAELGKVIFAATARHRLSACGIWVLAERDASDLIRYSHAILGRGHYTAPANFNPSATNR
jgi:hypothetical protein